MRTLATLLTQVSDALARDGRTSDEDTSTVERLQTTWLALVALLTNIIVYILFARAAAITRACERAVSRITVVKERLMLHDPEVMSPTPE